MSINQETPERTLWWNQQQQQNPSITIQPQLYNNNHHQATWLNSNTPQHRFNLNIEDQEEDQNDDVMEEEEQGGTTQEEEKEPMFEKSLTPSDVGKLNRLVIPKQHAEKYFPLGGGGADSGLLLSFEDESGKCWRFRYSYWNSSQSYVLTKGWSRYVKDKRLDAGDVVLFLRHRVDSHRFFITWRRRHATPPAHVSTTSDGNGPVHPRGYPYPTTHHHHHHHHSLPYQPDSLHAGGESQGQNQITQGGNSSSSGSKVLRLFGVNMECKPDIDSETFTPESSATQQFYYHNNQPSHSSSNPHHHILRQQPF